MKTNIYFDRFPKLIRTLLNGKRVFILIDKNVAKYYGEQFIDYPLFIIESGEKNKNFDTVFLIYRWLLGLHAGRDAFILGVGGGVVCDIAGFVAATFMRGVTFGFISTSLLSQVDASVGGKNGVNFDGLKNIIGTIVQPEFVICDPQTLKTLPEEEYINGLAEVVKHALLSGEEFVEFMENNVERIMYRHAETMEFIVRKSVEIKANVVTLDEREKNLRKILNFGHTFGHAIELSLQLRHGYAVAIGIVFAAHLSCEMGYLKINDKKRIIRLLEKLNLPIFVQADPDVVFEKILHDKKRFGDTVDFILIRDFGDCTIESICVDTLRTHIVQFLKSHGIS